MCRKGAGGVRGCHCPSVATKELWFSLCVEVQPEEIGTGADKLYSGHGRVTESEHGG